jgi:hypothetical protein
MIDVFRNRSATRNLAKIATPAPPKPTQEARIIDSVSLGESRPERVSRPSQPDSTAPILAETPELLPQTPLRGERELQWLAKQVELGGVADGLGLGLDEPIVDTVAALQVNGLPTRQSCGGHIDWGCGAPWVDIQSKATPSHLFSEKKGMLFYTTRFQGQEETFREVAEEAGISVEELMSRDNFEKYEGLRSTAFQRSSEKGETEEYRNFVTANKKLRLSFDELLEEYHQKQNVPPDQQIKIAFSFGDNAFRLHSGSKKDLDRDAKSMTEQDKQQLEARLGESRYAMQAFADHLKERFLAQGPAFSA